MHDSEGSPEFRRQFRWLVLSHLPLLVEEIVTKDAEGFEDLFTESTDELVQQLRHSILSPTSH